MSSGKRAGLDAAAAEGLWNAWFGDLDWQILWAGNVRKFVSWKGITKLTRHDNT